MASKLGKMMSDLIREQRQAPQATPGEERHQEVYSLYKQGLQSIRGQRNMHPDRKRVEVAALYETTRAALKKIQQDQAAEDAKNRVALERTLFGHPGDRLASEAASVRDAADRASQLKKPSEAARSLQEAERAGDQVLARAIAKQAAERGWGDVLEGYLDARPKAAEAYGQLQEIARRQDTAHGVLRQQHLTALSKPEEIRGLSDDDITGMTDDGPTAA